ncbi:MAG: UDP-3-O-(3-hydroxymyristoyl)glucosamine N-acyltransferase [Pseudomonadota bacterium]
MSEIAAASGAALRNAADGERTVSGVAALAEADRDALSFLDNKKYAPALETTGAGAVIVAPSFVDRAPAGCAVLASEDPYRAFARAAAFLHPDPEPVSGVHPSAIIDPSAELADGVVIGPGAVVGAGAAIGVGARVGPNAVIGRRVVIGARTDIGANASLEYCLVGADCLIHAGARIGTRGFGFAMGANGHETVPQLGRVLVGDQVEIGANATIDRGAGPDTVIGDGCRIDNLVQIAHNVRLGRGCVVVAQAGVAGSATIGDFAALGGQAGVAGPLTIGAGAQLAAQCGLMRDVAAGEAVGGSPATGFREWMREVAWLRGAARRKRKGDTE